jgi:hypothetical protein
VATVRDTFHQKKNTEGGIRFLKKNRGGYVHGGGKAEKLIGPEWCDPDIDGIAP